MSSTNNNDPVLSLPYEIMVEIFLCLPPNQIVTVCRRVSSTWKEFVDNPHFWLFGLRKCRNFDPKLIKVPFDEVCWPKLYLSTAFGPNLIKSIDSDTGELSLRPWVVAYQNWSTFSTLAVDRDDYDQEAMRGPGGGNKWSIESAITQEDPHFEQIVKENDNSTKNYVTSYEWCCRERSIKLSNFGFSNSIMDDVQPSISVSEWYAARWDCGSVFCIRVDLLNSDKEVITSYEDSVTTDQWQGGPELGWRRVENVFRNYGRGVRFVRFADGGKDTKWWAGHYGSKMAGARLVISF